MVDYVRPFVGLDGAHTSGEYRRILLLATCLDGENKISILLLYQIENIVHWTWFMENLKNSCPQLTKPDMVFVSDRDKGLKPSLPNVFLEACHS
jgi:hypothetical protein